MIDLFLIYKKKREMRILAKVHDLTARHAYFIKLENCR